MKRLFFFLLLSLVMLVVSNRILLAAEIEENYAYSRVVMPEILIGLGTRAPAMGGVGVANSNDISSLYWNPAGLQQIKYPEVEFIHNSWIQETNRESFLFAVPFSRKFVIGVNANYLNLGTIEKTDITSDGRLIFEGTQINLAMFGGSLGAGIAITPLMSFGLAARVVVQDLGDTTPFSLMGDIGWQYRGIENIDLGVAVRNLGLGVAGYSLPISGTLGAAYKAKINRTSGVIIGLDLEVLFHELVDSIVHVGFEYNFARVLTIRTGYQLSGATQPEGLAGLTAGLGIAPGMWNFGYTIAPHGELGLTHRISVALNLKQIGKSRSRAKKPKQKRSIMTARMDFDAQSDGFGSRDISSSPTTKEEAAMRSLLKDNVQVEARITKATAKTKGAREVHFKVKRTSGARIVRWSLKLEGRKGKKIRVLKGTALPKMIIWDGKNTKGNFIKAIKGVRYYLTLTDINGQSETQKGRVGVNVADTPPNAKKHQVPRLVEAEIFGPVLFEKGRAEIRPKAADIIAKAAVFIQSHPRTKVLIEGYADSVNEEARKVYLSKARAEAVARYLTAYHKVHISRILVRGRGDKNPAVNNSNYKQRYRNRRVIITVREMKVNKKK
ncbi:PorV/PorQ family protein [bacterium]|nr:PorV/PorQ family protein [bacterium]